MSRALSFGFCFLSGPTIRLLTDSDTDIKSAPAPTTLPSPAPIEPSPDPSVIVEWVHMEGGSNGEA